MSQTYQFTFVDAPVDTVWRVIFHEAEQQGSIIVMEEPSLLVVQSQDVCSVYALRQYPAMENKTGVYLVMTHDEAAAIDLVNAPDLFRALEAMPIDVVSDVYEDAKAHLQDIKTLANEAGNRIAVSAYRGDVQKSSIDPNKSGEPIAAPPYGQGIPVVKLGLIWLMFILLGGIFSAASLLALNWWSLGKPRKAISTFVATIISWNVFLLMMT